MANIRTRKQARADSLENVLSGKGSRNSKSGSKVFARTTILDHNTIRNIYESGGIGAKIITRVADDITRKGFRIDAPNGEKIKEKFDALGGTTAFNTAIRWARAYGGALIVIVADDGGELDEPLDITKVKNIERLDVYEAGCSGVVEVDDYYENEYNSNYGQPETYRVQSMDGSRFEIHESRCIRLDGRPSDSTSRSLANGWNGSELQPVIDALLSMFSQLMSGEQVLDEMVIGVLKIENLDSMCIDTDGEDLLRKRLWLVDTSKSNERTIAIDINEDYTRHTVNLSGMPNIQHNAMNMVAGSADIPATFLFGTSPDGQNATGASDKEQYYGKIDAERLYMFKPALLKLLVLLGAEPNVKIIFPSLAVSSLYDTARAMDHTCTALKNMVDSLIISADEAKKMLSETKLIEKISVLE